jgi:hypothetical protein
MENFLGLSKRKGPSGGEMQLPARRNLRSPPIFPNFRYNTHYDLSKNIMK